MTAPDGFLSVQDAAAVIGVCRATMYIMIRADEIPSVKFGGRRLVPASALSPRIPEAKTNEANHVAR
ncbi:MAG: helix-turn-helix domain-containing protein [Streptosporangiaceae bacterium]